MNVDDVPGWMVREAAESVNAVLPPPWKAIYGKQNDGEWWINVREDGVEKPTLEVLVSIRRNRHLVLHDVWTEFLSEIENDEPVASMSLMNVMEYLVRNALAVSLPRQLPWRG